MADSTPLSIPADDANAAAAPIDNTVNNVSNANPAPSSPDTSTNWRSSLDTKDMQWLQEKGFVKEDTTPEQFAKTLTKSYRELTSLQGVDEKSLARIPGKDATSEEKAAFYAKIGRPEAADRYDLKIPEGIDTDPKLVDWFKGAAFEKGLTNDQANGVLNQYLELEKTKMTEYQDALKSIDAQDTQTLKKDWGSDYDKNLEIARRGALAQGWTEEQLNAMGNTIGKAALYKPLLNYGKAVSEDQRLESTGVVNGQRYTPESAQAELKRLESDRGFSDKYFAKDADAVRKFQELNDIAWGNEPVGRTSG